MPRWKEGDILAKFNKTYPCYLKQNQCNEMPKHIIVLDTETYLERKDELIIHTIRLGHIIYSYSKGNKWYDRDYSFNTIERAWEIIDEIRRSWDGKRTFTMIAHNMAFDYQILNLDGYISSRNMTISLRVLEPFIIRAVDANNRGLEILSSTNWFHGSLRQIGHIFNVEKGNVEDFENVDDITLDKYCYNDTWVLLQIVKGYIKWLEDNDLGNFAPTIAGQAFNAFRHRFMEPNSILLHRFPQVETMERESYRGGRCEAFFIGDVQNVHKVDVNSMYPFLMATKEYPIRLLSGANAILPNDINDIEQVLKEEHRFIIANVALDMNEGCIGIKRDKLIFPIGKFKATLTTPELNYIINDPDIGKILNFQQIAVYETKSIFSEYVKFFYHLKQNARNPSEKLMSKLFLNSLYGKFGQRQNSETRNVEDPAADEIDINAKMAIESLGISRLVNSENKRTYVRLGDAVYQCPKKLDESSENSFCAIASAVTSYARIYLDELIRKAGRENVFYCDTDSLVVNDLGLQNLTSYMDENELGKLKLEESGDITIRGSKNYIFNDKRYLKGVTHDAIYLGHDTWEMDQWHTKSTHYGRNDEPGSVVVSKVQKQISNLYDKGNVGINGIVTPLYLNEL